MCPNVQVWIQPGQTLGRGDCASVLNQTLGEEKAADLKLTGIAEARVNRVAV